MPNKQVLSIALLLSLPLFLAWLIRPFAPQSAPVRPNILLITADDLGHHLSSYGERRIATPNLDQLAAQGVRFDNAYVAQSSCSPSRAALLTGRWPHQNGQIGLSHLGFHMNPGQPNLPALLKANGYQIGIIGKLHVEPAKEFDFEWAPKGAWFDHRPTRDMQWVTEQAGEFMQWTQKSGRPFFLYVNYFDPHNPFSAETDQVNGLPEHPLKAEDIDSPLPFLVTGPNAKRQETAHFFNAVLRLDGGIKLLMDRLAAEGHANDTIVIFTGDNGNDMARAKAWSYEAGVKVPLIVRWPGTAKAGLVRPELTSLLDLMPTLLQAAGIEAPPGLAGQPLQPLLRGESPPWREFLFTEMNFHAPVQYRPQRTVRDDRYKLLLNLAPEQNQAPVELYDLANDPDELKNLAEDPDLAMERHRLEAALQSWRADTADPLLDPDRLERWGQMATQWITRYKTSGALNIPKEELRLLE